MNRTTLSSIFAIPLLLSAMTFPGQTLAADKAPNILVIMGDDIGWSNICLLYTSPSPRDGLLSRMPSSA